MSMRPLPVLGNVQVNPEELLDFQERHPFKPTNGNLRWRVALVVEVAAILGLWELVVASGLADRDFLPPPSAIGSSFVELLQSPFFLDALWFSLGNLLIGLTIASTAGIIIGLAVGWSRLLEVTVAPFLWTFYSIPKVALAPLIILGLGLGSPSKIALVIMLAFFPIALNTIEGVATVEASLVRAGRVFGVHGARLILRVVLPAALPFVLVGLRRGVALAFIGEILGEFLGGANGLGVLLERATFDFRMDDAFAIVVVMVVTANIGLLLVDLIRRKAAPWYTEGPKKAR